MYRHHLITLSKGGQKTLTTYILNDCILNNKLAYSGVGPREEHPQAKQSKNRSTDNSKYFQSHLRISRIGYMHISKPQLS